MTNLQKIGYFEPSSAVSRGALQSVIDVERKAGTIGADLTVDRLILPGLTDLAQ